MRPGLVNHSIPLLPSLLNHIVAFIFIPTLAFLKQKSYTSYKAIA